MNNKGALIFARNNDQIDYVKQAYFLATRIKKYLNIPTSIATDSVNYLHSNFDVGVFDKVIELGVLYGDNYRNFNDGTLDSKKSQFKNIGRSHSYDLSPYDQTLLLDSDYIISNNLLSSCFDSANNFMLYQKGYDITKVRDEKEFNYVSDSSVDFYWATCVFFRKTQANKIFFDLVSHIQENYQHYRKVYQINSKMFRNDYAFSIAVHIMNGFQKGNFVHPLPGKLLYTLDKDILWSIQDDNFLFLAEKQNFLGEYTPIKTRGQSVHIMNKFSLARQIDKELNYD